MSVWYVAETLASPARTALHHVAPSCTRLQLPPPTTPRTARPPPTGASSLSRRSV